MADFDVKFQRISGDVFSPSMEAVNIVHVGAEPYEGTYDITPTTEEQTLITSQKILSQNITIHKIPQQYGLVTYDQNKTIKIT